MRVSAALPTGVEALLFASAKRHRQLESDLVQHLEGQGFAEVILPVLDFLKPYEAILSPASREELYRFVDRGGELLALRSDFTPMLARLLAPRLGSLELPLKLFYRGDVLRYQEARAGQLRELYQVGAEVLGLPGVEAEAKVLTTFVEMLASVAQERPRVVLGFSGALDRLLLSAGGTLQPAQLAHAVARRERDKARAGGEALLQIVEAGVPEDLSALGAEAADELQVLQTLCRDLGHRLPGVELSIDLAEFAEQALAPDLRRAVGERAYYDGLVFRAYAGHRGVPVGSGGRYDRLFSHLGADDGLTAAGFSFSLGRLAGAASEEGR